MQLGRVQGAVCGQVVALFSLSALLLAKRLARLDASVPSFLNLVFYLVLGLVFNVCHWCRRQPLDLAVALGEVPQEKMRWWVLPLLALLDIEANLCTVQSLSFTRFSTTAIMLNLAIPFVFIACTLLFDAPSSAKHALGCFFTVIGGGVMLIGCFHRQASSDELDEVTGWTLAVIGAALYAASNMVHQQYLKEGDVGNVLQLLGQLGIWGALLCAIQTLFLDLAQLRVLVWTTDLVLLVVGYAAGMAAFYTAVFVVVRGAETTVYNLSLVLANAYIVVMARYLLDEPVDAYTWSVLACMLVGLVIYSMGIHDSRGTSAHTQLGFRAVQTPREESLGFGMDLALAKIQRADV